MTETTLIALGFNKEFIDSDYYYVKTIGDVELITQVSDAIRDENDWFVQFYEYGSFTFTEAEPLKQLVQLLENNFIKDFYTLESAPINN